jgi:hypothetical protein
MLAQKRGAITLDDTLIKNAFEAAWNSIKK